jgi:hypothetical protein
MHMQENSAMINRDTLVSKAFVLLLGAVVLLIASRDTHAQHFREVDDYGWARGENFSTPFLIDLDGNGLLDLIVGTEQSGLLRWEQTAAHGTAFRRVKRDFMPSKNETRVAPIYHDIDGDGRLDLLLMNESGIIDHYIQNEPNSTEFTLHEKNFSGIKVWSAGRFWLGDLDGNGLLDIVTGSSDPKLQRYEQTSTRSFVFEQRRDLYLQSATYYLAPLLHDIDGDGLLEMILGGQGFNLRLLRQHAVVKDSFLLVTEMWNGIDDLENGTPIITDIDNNGLLDIFIGSKGGLIRHYEQPSPNALDGWRLRNGNVLNTWDFGLHSHSIVYDLDGDGRLDILRTEVPMEISGVTRGIHHFHQTAVGALTLEHRGMLTGLTAGIYDKLAIADLDQDGLLDLFIVRNQKGMEHYRQRTGHPFVFDLVSENILPEIPWTRPYIPMYADLDGNGKLDLLLFNENKSVSRLEQEAPGSARFVMINENWMTTPDSYPSAHIMDYNNDGLLDMILGGLGGKLLHYRQTASNATSFEAGDLDLAAINVKLHSQPTMVDVNNDGRLDLIVGDGAGGLSLYIDQGPVSTDVDAPASADFRISQLSPNPCTGPVMLTLELQLPRNVTVAVYDILGREMLRPMDGALMLPGQRQIGFDVRALPAGFYTVVASADGQRSSAALMIR